MTRQSDSQNLVGLSHRREHDGAIVPAKRLTAPDVNRAFSFGATDHDAHPFKTPTAFGV
jgi:hypothetical protein